MYWEDGQEFVEALEGAFGDEEQEEALDFAEESGLMDEWLAEAQQAGYEGGDPYEGEGYDPEDEDAYVEGQMVAGIEDELEKIEGALGRNLSQKEERQILGTISGQDWHEGVVPDLAAQHVPEMQAAVSGDREDRVTRMAAAADAARELKEAEEPDSFEQPDWQQPSEPDEFGRQMAAHEQE